MFRILLLFWIAVSSSAQASPGERHEVEPTEWSPLPWSGEISFERLQNSLKDVHGVLSRFKPRDLDYSSLAVDPESSNHALLRFDAHIFGKTLPFRGHSYAESTVGVCRVKSGAAAPGFRVVMVLRDSHPWIVGNFSQVEADLCILPEGGKAAQIAGRATLVEGGDRGTLTYPRVKELLSRQVRPLLDALVEDMGAGVHER